jgi:hypothetical protein
VRAQQDLDTTTSPDVDKLVKDLQDKWDKVENKTGVVLYGAGAVVLLWFSSTLVSALNAIPLLPKLLELVGLGYTSWFVYRYLLFKSSREELAKDVEELKKKITGELN